MLNSSVEVPIKSVVYPPDTGGNSAISSPLEITWSKHVISPLIATFRPFSRQCPIFSNENNCSILVFCGILIVVLRSISSANCPKVITVMTQSFGDSPMTML